MIRPFTLALLFLFPLTVSAADEALPKSTAPTFVKVKAVEKNAKLQLFVTTQQFVPENRTVDVQVGNRIEKRTQTFLVPVTVDTVYELDGKTVALQRADGKAVDNKDVLKELGTGKLILRSEGKVDPQYLKLFKDDTIILVFTPK